MPAFQSNELYIYDDTDTTKQFRFSAAAIPTGTLRILTIPPSLASQNSTLAVTNFDNAFTAAQSFLVSIVAGSAVDEASMQIRIPGSGSTLARLFSVFDGSSFFFQIDPLGAIVSDTSAIADGSDPTKKFFFDCTGITTATTRTLTVPDASGTIALTSAIPSGGLAASTYSPTRSAESNLDANVTPSSAQYMRVGNVVTVSGRVTGVDPTAAGAASFELSLPIASNIGAVEDCAGVAFSGTIAGQGAAVTGSVANNTAVFSWIAVDTTSQSWSYTYSYEVI